MLVGSCKDPTPLAAQPDVFDEASIADAGLDLAIDARADAIAALREALDAGTFRGPYARTTTIQTSVMSEPAWTEDGGTAVKLGYLRTASPVPVVAGSIVNDQCSEGWYELVEGGFVCGKHVTFDADDAKLKGLPGPADISAPLPYKYGVVLFDGTPMYKRALPLDKRKKYEPWIYVRPSDNPYDDDDDETTVALPKNVKIRGKDGGKPTLGDLQGRGALLRRMMRGFLLSGDKEVELQGAKWWRTAVGNLVPSERVMAYAPVATQHGGFITRGAADGGAPLEATGGAVMKADPGGKYSADLEKKSLAGIGTIAKGTPLGLVGEAVSFYGAAYQQTSEGFWVKLSDVIAPKPEPPPDLVEGEKWIDVDLGKQVLVAFEGKRAVYVARISSGRRNPWDAQHDYPTPTGVYRIREKHVTTTMDGDLAADGPYSIEDVPWVMYFKGSYALHGAFWHDDFGHPRSHGCINLSPQDARALFFWVDPRLPTGWHGVFATGRSGTRVVIHEPTK